jgi:hypothetical protein
MDHTEETGYVRMTGQGESFALHRNEGNALCVNLRWLAEIIRHYEAGERKLTIPGPKHERVAAREIEILRPIMERVNSEKYEKFTREHHPRS